ncbi:MAG: hypothetical protein KJ956_13115, partial [Actinobacteria bacterium]|nr:hypothetical protein [Actinomycetota bacterium]
MSRSDEEGFHPHPGDPWHPGWDDEVDDDVEPLVPKHREVEPAAEDRPKRRGRRGRRKPPKAGESAPPDDFAASDEDLPEPSGWEAYDDELVAADLESMVPPGVPTWTEEGGSSVEFESAFTVGGDLGPDDAGEQDAPAPPGIVPGPATGGGPDLSAPGPTGEPLPVAADEDPTMLLGETVVPDVPDLSALPAPEEASDAAAEDSLRRLDALLGDGDDDDEPVTDESELLADLLAAAAVASEDEAAGEPADDGVLEIPAEAGIADLTRAAEDAAAALRARSAEVRQDQALEIAADELGAVEIEAIPEPPALPGGPAHGLQDSLLFAGLELPEDGSRVADPGFTPEEDEGDDGAAEVRYPSIAPLPAGIDDGPRRVPVDPDEIAPVDDVDAALSAIAEEPIAAADPDALAALRAIDEDEDFGDWHAFAEGEAVLYPEPPEVAEPGEFFGDLGPPLVPSMSSDDLLMDDADEEPSVKRGLFGRRKGRKGADPADSAGGDGWAADDETTMDGGAETDLETPTGDVGRVDDLGAPETAAADDGWDDDIA